LTCFFVESHCPPKRKRGPVKTAIKVAKTDLSASTGQQLPVPCEGGETGEHTCPFCFLSPCIIAHPHDWLGDGQRPCQENSGMRRVLYNRYWKCMDNQGAWRLESYLQKKTRQAPQGSVAHRREIMPECVVKQVRDLYPNPVGQPYMGHKWE